MEPSDSEEEHSNGKGGQGPSVIQDEPSDGKSADKDLPMFAYVTMTVGVLAVILVILTVVLITLTRKRRLQKRSGRLQDQGVSPVHQSSTVFNPYVHTLPGGTNMNEDKDETQGERGGPGWGGGSEEGRDQTSQQR